MDRAGLPPAAASSGSAAAFDARPITGIADFGMISVWGERWWSWELATEITSHETLHALASVGHRHAPDHMMRFPLSRTDRALLEPNFHPLVRPRMSMEQVRRVIVLEDELLDSGGPDPLELLWRAGEISSSARSARFELSGEWSGGACRFDSFGPIEYEVSEFDDERSGLAHVVAGQRQYWFRDDRYLTWENGTWQPLSEYGIQIDTGWLHELTDPLPLLRWATLRGAGSGFDFISSGDGMINLVSEALHVPESVTPIADARVTIDPASYRVVAYQMTRHVADSCQLHVTVVGGAYGDALSPPAELDLGRRN